MEIITVKDRTFKKFIPHADILKQVDRVAGMINRDLAGRNPLFLVVLNGAFMFAADLMKRITIPAELQFIRLSSYQGVDTTGKVNELLGLDQSIEGRTVVVVEDIVDTGITMNHLLKKLGGMNPKEIRVCTLFLKPGKLRLPLHIDYAAMEIPDDFILGYGVDYDEYGRNYPDIYTLTND